MNLKEQLKLEAIKLANIINNNKPTIKDKVNYIEIYEPRDEKYYRLEKQKNESFKKSSSFR